jgi:hypothetical protein
MFRILKSPGCPHGARFGVNVHRGVLRAIRSSARFARSVPAGELCSPIPG